MIVFLFLLLTFLTLALLTNYYPNLITLNKQFIENTSFYSFRNYLINIVENKYSTNIATLINLILFNQKNYQNEVVKNISNLNITYLFTVSGMHVSILLSIPNLIIKKQNIKCCFNFLFCIFYGYFLTYSISIIRILLNNLVKFIKPKLNGIETNCLTGIFLVFIIPQYANHYGFIMSYFCTIAIIYLINVVNNKFVIGILINIICFLITIPMILTINQKINIFAFFYNLLFTNLIVIFYFWLLIFCFVPFCIPLTLIFGNLIYQLLLICNDTSIYIFINKIYAITNAIYYLFLGFGWNFFVKKCFFVYY